MNMFQFECSMCWWTLVFKHRISFDGQLVIVTKNFDIYEQRAKTDDYVNGDVPKAVWHMDITMILYGATLEFW